MPKRARRNGAPPLNFAKYDGGGDAGEADNKGGDGPRSTPTIIGNRVYAMSSQLSLRCFDTANGKVVWTRDLLQEHNGRNMKWQNATSPLLEGGLLYVGGGGQGESLLAVDPKDGKVVWKAFDENITHSTPVAATILGQRQVIFFVQSGLLSVEPKTGKELWRYKFDFRVSTAASPVVFEDIVYCSAGYGVGAGAVKIAKQGDNFTATEIYRFRGDKPLANHWSTPVVKDGYLYGMFQFKEYGKGPVKCVDIRTGDVKWEKEGFGPGHVILAGDQVLALSDKGELVLLAADPAGLQRTRPRRCARRQVLDHPDPRRWPHLRAQHQGSGVRGRERKVGSTRPPRPPGTHRPQSSAWRRSAAPLPPSHRRAPRSTPARGPAPSPGAGSGRKARRRCFPLRKARR